MGINDINVLGMDARYLFCQKYATIAEILNFP